ncbi:MAG: cytidine deaminase [Simkaniaceae bacterium]|nr:cytidine deaminase [Simkaniaceae bacterium]
MTKDNTLEQMYTHAKQAQAHAYCPYSKYQVGAALRAKSGEIYTGCNVENASWSVSICAERTALVKALSEGEREFTHLLILTRDGGISCGICRQMLNEFSPDLEIITSNSKGIEVLRRRLSELLPEPFGPTSLQHLAHLDDRTIDDPVDTL